MFFYNYKKAGKGINKEDLDKSGVELYFDILVRRIWKLMSLNVFYIIASIPAIVIAGVISLYFFTLLASFKNLSPEENASSITILSALLAFLLIQIAGSGPATVAKSYVLRKYVNDEHAWVFSDFVENIKKNFKQGLVVYITNILTVSILLLAWSFYSYVMKNSILSIGAIVLALVFAMMQPYVHQLVASMELKVKHIYKNALVLTLIKLPWNVLVAAVTYAFIYLTYYSAIKIPALFIFVILGLYFAIVSFTQIFMTNNIMNKYVIEPGIEREREEKTSDSDE